MIVSIEEGDRFGENVIKVFASVIMCYVLLRDKSAAYPVSTASFYPTYKSDCGR